MKRSARSAGPDPPQVDPPPQAEPGADGGVAPGESRRPSPALLLLALVLAALNLRPALSSVSAELNDIRAELGLSGLAAGALTTLPVACMGIFAGLAAPLARRAGAERTIVAGLILIGTATAARGLGIGAAAFMVVTLAIGLGIAVVQALAPPIVKAYFARSPGLPTGLFTVGIHVGALLGAALTVPIAELTGASWRAGVAAWGALALPAAAVWIVLGHRSAGSLREQPDADARTRVRVGRGLTLQVAIVFAAVSAGFYVPLAWLVAALEDTGLSEGSAVALFALFVGAQVPGAFLVPAIARTPRARGLLLAVLLAVSGVSLLFLGLATEWGTGVWAFALGFGLGAAFALALTLGVDHTPTPAQAATLTGIAFTLGYVAAAIGPAVSGLLRDATGETALPLAVLGAAVLVSVPVALRLVRRLPG